MPPSVCKPWSLVFRSMTWRWCIREETRHSYQTPFQDCFSQPVSKTSQSLKQFNMIKYLPVSEERLQQIQKDIEADESLQVFKVVIQKGWPKHKSIFPTSTCVTRCPSRTASFLRESELWFPMLLGASCWNEFPAHTLGSTAV